MSQGIMTCYLRKGYDFFYEIASESDFSLGLRRNSFGNLGCS